LDSCFKTCGVFKILAKVWAYCQPLPMQQNPSKSTQRQLVQETSKYHQKHEILVFKKKKQNKTLLCVKAAPKHVHTILIFNTRISHMPFSLSKNGLCM
jgi:hypothetical protein